MCYTAFLSTTAAPAYPNTIYKALTSVTIKDQFPIPFVDKKLDELPGASYFTKLDLRAGYHQVRVNPFDIHKTVFHTHNDHY
jgi:hypothetical protein